MSLQQEGDLNRETQWEIAVAMGMKCLENKERQGLLEPPEAGKRHRTDALSESPERTIPAYTLI